MDTERNLLFGVVALQSGAVDADGLAETCAAWSAESTLPLADLMVDRGLMTDEQRTRVEETVARELASHGGDAHATLAATIDGRSLEAIGGSAGAGSAATLASVPPPQGEAGQGGHVVLGRLSPGAADARERYTLTHLHAKGGMGRVWLARDGALSRQIALKELRPDQSDNTIVCSRFLYEAKITAQLEHPGIVPVYELGEGDAPYYTMRFVRGGTLSEAIRAYHKKRAAGEADSVGLVDLLTAYAAVCHAVAYAHSRGVIHRDLKGQNVVLGDFGEVIVLDWGLAKRVGPDPDEAQGSGAEPAAEAAADGLSPEAPVSVTCAAAASDVDFTLAHDPEGVTSAAAPSDDGFNLAHDPEGVTSAASVPAPGTASGAGSGSGHGSGPGTDGGAHGSGRSSSARRGIPESGAGPEGTMQGQLLGTPAFMAPEQAQGRHDLVDRRTDIYGLGAILYEILAGRPPFVAPRTTEVIQKVIHEEPTPPRQVVPEIPPALEAVCLKAIRKEKADRYQSASELAREVRRYLADEPVEAYAEPWTQRAARWARRNRTKVAAAAGLLVAATVALAVSTVLVSRERNEAETQGQQARRAVHLLTKGADIAFDDQLDPVQKEMLEDALAYYETFTGRKSNDPAVRLEHGRAYQQMGDLQRKLGRLGDSEAAYGKAIAVLEPLAGAAGAGREARRALARTRTLLADLLVRRGGDKDKAGPLYARALEAQLVLADAERDPAAGAEDLLRLGQTYKSQGDLARLDGRFAEAGTVYDRALAALERATAAGEERAEVRAELALAVDARGWIHRELGDMAAAETGYHRAVELLEKLVAEFPTVPRHREVLARALNSLALIEQDTGRLADAESHLGRELPLAERLSQDFPDRPEYRRVLARTLSNLGIVLSSQQRNGDAEPVLRRAVEVNAAVSAKSPDDVQIRFDLAKDHVCLGDLLREKGDTEPAIAELRTARAIVEKLVETFPDRPRYRNLLAEDLVDLALAMQWTEPAKSEELYRTARDLFDKLVAAYPDNVDYRIGQATCLRNEGAALAAAGQAERAEAAYRRALAQLDAGRARVDSQGIRIKAEVLNNLGDLLRGAGRPEAEVIFRQAQGLFTELASRPAATLKDRHNLAIAEYNLGETLFGLKRLAEAEAQIARAEAGFEKLILEAPKSVDYRSQLGLVQGRKGAVLVDIGKLPEAAAVLARAVGHQDRAVRLSKNRSDTRTLLGGHLLELAEVHLKRGAYQEAADEAVRVPRAVPESGRGEACLDAARILARLVGLVGADPKLVPADRERLIRPYLRRSIVLLHEATDCNPKLAGRLKDDPALKALESRPEFKTMMNSLVDLRR